MKLKDFGKNSPGKLVDTKKGFYCFVPNDLPPSIEWNENLLLSLSRANRSIGKLSTYGLSRSPHLFVYTFIRREAVTSSGIEGTTSTISELLVHESGIKLETNTQDTQEVFNYIKALNYGVFCSFPSYSVQEIPLRSAQKLGNFLGNF